MTGGDPPTEEEKEKELNNIRDEMCKLLITLDVSIDTPSVDSEEDSKEMNVEIKSTGSEEKGDSEEMDVEKEEEESNNEFLYDNDECLKIAEFKKYLDDMEPKTRVKRKVGEIGQKGEETVVEGEHETTLGGGKTNYEKVVGSIDFNEIAGKRIFNAYQGPILDDIDNDNTNEKIRGEIDSFLKFYNRETKLDDIYKTIRILIIKDIVFNNIYKNEMIYDEDPEKNSDPIEFVNEKLKTFMGTINYNKSANVHGEYDAAKLKPEDDIVLGATSDEIYGMMLDEFTTWSDINNGKHKYVDVANIKGEDNAKWASLGYINKIEKHFSTTDKRKIYEDITKQNEDITTSEANFFNDLVTLNDSYEQTNFVKGDNVELNNIQIAELIEKWKSYQQAYNTIKREIDLGEGNIESIIKLLDAGLTMRNDYSLFFRNPTMTNSTNKGRRKFIWSEIIGFTNLSVEYINKKGGGRKTRKSKNKSTRNGRRRSRARKYNCTKRRHKNTKTRKRNVKNNNLEI